MPVFSLANKIKLILQVSKVCVNRLSIIFCTIVGKKYVCELAAVPIHLLSREELSTLLLLQVRENVLKYQESFTC